MTVDNVAEARESHSNKLAHEHVPVTATCPKCRRQIVQHGYSRVALFSFLDMSHPIDAYCKRCDEVWAINAEERHAIAESLAA